MLCCLVGHTAAPCSALRCGAQSESVEESRRRDAYQRSQRLAAIAEETQRACQLLERRKALQGQRRMANLQASLQRQ